MKNIFQFFTKFFIKGKERSVKAKKNILASFIIKGMSVGSSLVLIPLTINYVNSSQYGIWLTISSIIGWFSFFDIGLTHGLRNKFAEAKAKGDTATAQIYVSTTYAILALIFSGLWILFLLLNPYLSWTKMLNLSATIEPELSLLVIIVVTYFCLSFILKVINAIILADQEPAKASLIDAIPQILSLGIIFVLLRTTEGSLVYLGIALCLSPIITLISANIILFRKKYKKYKPRFSKIDFSYAKGLFNLGLTFFVIQFAVVVQLETANILISRNFGPAEVTSFNIVYKFFSILSMVFIIFVTPFWSASTEAYFNKDLEWIKNGIRKYNYLNVLVFLVSVFMLIFSNNFYELWLGKGKVDISFSLSFWGFIFVNTHIFGLKYVIFLNGISALRIQFLICLFSPFIYLITAYIFIHHYNMGVYSLFIASVVANLNGMIMAPVQYYQVIIKNKKGIWIR
ncbi:oligosaccharide flippase family protein [uncultured Cyclobacterium sp.]|uniref:lipopolysaccharide biosynthesis protein n=1 Tax=uncultured Cyclobacterium sp. TaxID=453820 RepID=UPI0030ECAB4F|tara:strand:- start:122288 stop:123655 length:1368 start_codon:yes stop_codon:yes gene_type:complete